MTFNRWPELPVLGSATLQPMATAAGDLWPGVFTVTTNLPADHVLIGGVMVFLHGAVAGRQPVRMTRDLERAVRHRNLDRIDPRHGVRP